MEIKFNKEFEVKVTLTVKVGMTCRINNSYGCVDIPIGIITVVDIGTRQDMNNESYDFESWEVDGVIPEHWVKYKYKNEDQTDILPLEQFIDHTSIA